MNIETEARIEAQFIVDNGFIDEESQITFIAEVLLKFYKLGGRNEHDKIEKFIGTRNFHEARTMIVTAQRKYAQARAERLRK